MLCNYHSPLSGGLFSVFSESFTMFYTVFARYDAHTTDPDYGVFFEDGRCVYLTDSREDADRVWDMWQAGTYEEDHSFSIRRGCVDEYPTLIEAVDSDAMQWADSFDFADSLTEQQHTDIRARHNEWSLYHRYCPALPRKPSTFDGPRVPKPAKPAGF